MTKTTRVLTSSSLSPITANTRKDSKTESKLVVSEREEKLVSSGARLTLNGKKM
jgi:hypothetical protein